MLPCSCGNYNVFVALFPEFLYRRDLCPQDKFSTGILYDLNVPFDGALVYPEVGDHMPYYSSRLFFPFKYRGADTVSLKEIRCGKTCRSSAYHRCLCSCYLPGRYDFIYDRFKTLFGCLELNVPDSY